MADASRPEPAGPRSQADEGRVQPERAQFAADLADALLRLEQVEAKLEFVQERLRRLEQARSLGPDEHEHRRWGPRGLGSWFGRAS